MAAPAKEKGLISGFEATLDAHFEAMVSDESFKVPGVVVLARRGKDTYTYSGARLIHSWSGRGQVLVRVLLCRLVRIVAATGAGTAKHLGLPTWLLVGPWRGMPCFGCGQ